MNSADNYDVDNVNIGAHNNKYKRNFQNCTFKIRITILVLKDLNSINMNLLILIELQFKSSKEILDNNNYKSKNYNNSYFSKWHIWNIPVYIVQTPPQNQ